MTAPPIENPGDLSVRQVYEQFLDAKQLDYTEETLRDYETRLRQFVRWADDAQTRNDPKEDFISDYKGEWQ